MPNLIDITGETYGRLTVVSRAEDKTFPSGQRQRTWLCICECGTETVALANSLRTGHTKSCGCLRIDKATARRTSHGLTYHPLYGVWLHMLDRCRNVNDRYYHRYGGRGITVCDRWQGARGFPQFLADMGERPSDPPGWTSSMSYWSIDRIDPDGPYSPENCRWADPSTQQRNKSTSRDEAPA